jgi:hypothetical protein
MDLITFCMANFCNIQGLGTSSNHNQALRGIPYNDAFTVLVITSLITRYLWVYNLCTHHCNPSSPLHISTMLFTSLLTFVTIAVSFSAERVNADCCGCVNNPVNGPGGDGTCGDGTVCTPCCGYGPWYA